LTEMREQLHDMQGQFRRLNEQAQAVSKPSPSPDSPVRKSLSTLLQQLEQRETAEEASNSLPDNQTITTRPPAPSSANENLREQVWILGESLRALDQLEEDRRVSAESLARTRSVLQSTSRGLWANDIGVGESSVSISVGRDPLRVEATRDSKFWVSSANLTQFS